MFKSIRGKLLASHMTIFLIMVTMIFFGIIAVSKMREESSKQRLHLVSDHASEIVAMEIENISEKLKNICQSQVVQRFSESSQVPALTEYFANQSDVFAGLRFIDNSGSEKLRVLKGKVVDSGRDFQSDPFFLQSKQYPEESFIDRQFDIDESGIQIHLIYGLRKYSGKEFVGSVIAHYDVSLLSRFLTTMKVGEEGFVLIVDSQGRMLATPSGFATGGEVFANAFNRTLIMSHLKANKSFDIRGDIAGQDCFLVSSPVNGMPWSVITAQPYELFQKDIRKFKGLYLFLLAAVASLGWVIVYILADRLTFPILSLRDQVSKISNGLAETVELTSQDEVGELVKAFNEMLIDLRKTSVSLDFLDKVINSMNDILIVIDAEGKIVKTNIRAREILGYREKIITGISLQRILKGFSNENKVWYKALPWLLYKKPEETELVSSNGDLIPVLVTSSPFIDDKDKVNGAVLVAHDITERKEAEKKLAQFTVQLQESNRELEEFAYVASHDLKEPLRKIISFGDRLTMKFGAQLGERGNDYLARMKSAAERMSRLIDDLLSYSRVKSKARPFEVVDLNLIVSEVIKDLEASINDTQARVTVSGLATLNADPTQMRQLFQNLIGNGLKFHKPDVPPVIEVSGEFLENGNYQIRLKDNGIGIEEQYAEKIFGFLQRLHGRKEYDGSGIGLSVCKKIAIRHGGDISLISSPGDGSEFVVTLDPEVEEENVKEVLTGEFV